MSQSIITQGFSCETITLSTGEILDVYPSPGSLGIPIGANVVIIFDAEMDTTSINSGTFVLSYPDTDNLFSPGLESLALAGASSLSSSNYVDASIEFYKADEDGNILTTDITDTAGDGTLWRTVAVLSPSQPLNPNLRYNVFLSGDESQEDNFASGVRYRTVFDPVISKTGTGTASFVGGYTGSTTKTYVVRIVDEGETGTATYQWWDTSRPLLVKSGVTTTGTRLLENGVYISFGVDGTFNTDDQWTVICVPFVAFGSSSSWQFTTGNGSIVVPPSTGSTTGIIEVTNSTSLLNNSGFEVTRVVPENGTYGIEIIEEGSIYEGNQIIVTFGGTSFVDEDSLIGSITLKAEHALGNDSTHTAAGNLDFEAVLVDNELTINILPGQLSTNNIIVLTLDRNITNEDEDTLGEDFISYFSTSYTPLYTSSRRVALDIGPLLRDIEEEQIMLAILEASLFADSLRGSRTISNVTYYNMAKREFVSCYAEYLLINGMLSGGAGGRLSKKLGDLQVTRDGTNSVSDRLKSLEDCWSYWKVTIESGGEVAPNTSIAPGHSVKGALANDAIVVHRQWEPTSSHSTSAANAWKQSPFGSSRRGFTTFRKR